MDERNMLSSAKVDKPPFPVLTSVRCSLPELSKDEYALEEFVATFLTAEESLKESLSVS